MINIKKCKHKAKMTQTQMCLLYLTTYTISRYGFIEVDGAEVKFQKFRYEWKVKKWRKGKECTLKEGDTVDTQSGMR